jgi:hypothetical protein
MSLFLLSSLENDNVIDSFARTGSSNEGVKIGRRLMIGGLRREE